MEDPFDDQEPAEIRDEDLDPNDLPPFESEEPERTAPAESMDDAEFMDVDDSMFDIVAAPGMGVQDIQDNEERFGKPPPLTEPDEVEIPKAGPAPAKDGLRRETRKILGVESDYDVKDLPEFSTATQPEPNQSFEQPETADRPAPFMGTGIEGVSDPGNISETLKELNQNIKELVQVTNAQVENFMSMSSAISELVESVESLRQEVM